jgi:hypothetical protein
MEVLDKDMQGHVTYFSIARLIDTSLIDSLTSTLVLKGSVGYTTPCMAFQNITFTFLFLLTFCIDLSRKIDEGHSFNAEYGLGGIVSTKGHVCN